MLYLSSWFDVEMRGLGLVHSNRRLKHPKQVQFRLCEPRAGEECPIMREAMGECCLDFLPGVTFDQSKPRLCVMELACGHRMGAMNLVYHWARNGTVCCPVCRAGPPGARLNLRTLPVHFRSAMTRHVRAQQREDRDEAMEADAEVARAMQRDGVVIVFTIEPMQTIYI